MDMAEAYPSPPLGGDKGVGSVVRSLYHHSHESCHHAYEVASNYLAQRMDAQQHATGAEHAGKQYEEAEPPQRIETEDERERHYGSRGTADGCGVGGDLPPVVYYGTEYLYYECCNDNGRYDVRHMLQTHDIQACYVTHYRNGVWHHALLAPQQTQQRPSLVMSVQTDKGGGQQTRKSPHQQQYVQFVPPVEHAEVGKQEERQQPHERQVKWREYYTDVTRHNKYKAVSSHLLHLLFDYLLLTIY